MIKNFFSARLLVAALCVFAGLEALAELTLTRPAEAPDVLTSGNTTMWLDASDLSNFTRDGEKVTGWRNIANEANPAVPKVAANGSDIVYGTVGITNSVSAFRMGAGGSRIELGYNRLTDIRTVFWVMDIVDQMNGGFFLGDTSAINFHRGTGGQYGYVNETAYFDDEETIVKCDGVVATDKTNTHPPRGLHVYSAVMPVNCNSDRLSQDRGQASRNGGRALSELIVLNQALTEAEVAKVEEYLTDKWMNGNWGNEILIDDAQVNLKTIVDFMTNNHVNSARLKFTQAAEIIVDTALEGKNLIIDNSNPVSFSLAEGGTVAAFKNIIFLNEIAPLTISNFTGLLRMNTDGSLEIEDTLEIDVPYGEELRIDSLIGGKLVKTGDGTLRIGRVNDTRANVDGTTIEIKAGKVFFHEDDGAIFLNTPTYILHQGAQLDNYGWPKVEGTLTFESDNDVTIFTNNGANTAEFEGEHIAIVKRGAGRIDLKCGSSNDNAHHNVISSIKVEGGTLAFSGTRAKVITAVSGAGTLEEAGGGAMTISKIAPETSLKVTEGALNNDCPARNGGIELGGLEISAGATYKMDPAIDHLTITKALYLEGEAYKKWYVTLVEGALIATNPENPMTLAGLEFGETVKIGKSQSIGSILANVIKPKNMPEVVTSEDERLAKIPFSLAYNGGAIVVGHDFGVELETIPGQNLTASTYKVYLTNIPEGFSGKLYARISNPNPQPYNEIKRDITTGKWYVVINEPNKLESKGGAYKVKVELGIVDNRVFTPIEEYSDISLNVRPSATKKDLINETVYPYDRWNTGDWNTEGEYITISDGYVQIEGEKVSFVPGNPNEEAATKLHFAVKFGEAMKLEILNALTENGQLAGVSLTKSEDGTVGYAVLDSTANEYVAVTSSDLKPIDVDAEHLVEVTLTKSGVAYSIDGAALVTDDDAKSSVFALPKDTSIQIAEIDFEGKGAVKSMTAEEYSTKLASYNGTEYDTIEKAIAAAGSASRIEITPLWNASWKPSSELVGKTIFFGGKYVVTPNTNNDLAKNDMVLRPNADGSYSVISKFLTITIRDPEDVNNGFGVFLESVTANSMHLGWVYDYKSDTPTLAKATVVYNDDVTISFSNTLDNGANGALLVAREGAEDGEGNAITAGTQVKSVTFHQVRYDTEVVSKHIPVLGGENMDSVAKAKVKALYDYGIAAPKAMTADINIIDFTAASDGVTFNIAALDGVSDAEKIAAVSNLVWFSTDLKNWKLVADDGIRINEDGSITVKQVGSTGFYKVSIR